MQLDYPTLTVPLHTDEHGVIRVSGTRIPLEVILARYTQGDTAEAIHDGFPTLPLADIHFAIGYAMQYPEDVAAYLERRDVEAEAIRQKIEATYSPVLQARNGELHALIEQRRAQREDGNTP